MIPHDEALTRLREGNRRFVQNLPSENGLDDPSRRQKLALGQEPFAVILCCSDSRVPAEFIFDQGLGDLFVIRVAGNIVAPSQVGSIEYGTAITRAGLVVVMGHTKCGAITAAIDELQRPAATRSRNLKSIVDRIRPSVETFLETDMASDRDALIRYGVRANVRASVNQLCHGSEILERQIALGEVMIIGAEYSLDTGVVEFFDPPGQLLD